MMIQFSTLNIYSMNSFNLIYSMDSSNLCVWVSLSAKGGVESSTNYFSPTPLQVLAFFKV